MSTLEEPLNSVFENFINCDDISRILKVVDSTCIKTILTMYYKNRNSEISIDDVIFLGTSTNREIVQVCDSLYQYDYEHSADDISDIYLIDDLYQFVRISARHDGNGEFPSEIVQLSKLGIYKYLISRIYYVVPPIIIPLDIIEAHLKYAWCYPEYWVINRSFFYLASFKKEIFKFCQNPESEFNEAQILDELTEDYIVKHCFTSDIDRQKYSNYINTRGILPNPNSCIAEALASEDQKMKNMLEDARSNQQELFKRAVKRCAGMIRHVEL